MAQDIEILAFTKYGVDLLADDAQLAWLRARPYPVSESPVPLAPAGAAALDANLGAYHTYAELDTALTALVTAYPALAQRSVIGTSIEGRSIYALKVSDNVTVNESEPEVLYMGNHHARELMSVDIPLRFAQYLLANYGVDAEVTDYIDNREIWFIPMVNPDGHVYVQLNHATSPGTWWRKNRRDNGNFTYGVDLNRNYAYQWGYDNIGSSPSTGSDLYRGTGPFSEPETQAVRTFVSAHQFVTWFSYHTYGELLLYPWGYIYGNTPDHAVYEALGDSLVAENGYLAGNPASGAIYITNGGSDDWGYGQQISKNKIFAFTPEMNSSAQGGFGPDDTWIQPTFDLLLPMNMKLLKYAANPYQVVGPWAPSQYATQAPYGNGITRVSWTAPQAGDPNPTTHYEIEACRDPSFYTDTASPVAADWVLNGFSYTPSGLAGGGYFSGNADNIAYTMQLKRPLVVDADSDTLRFDINYNIETDYDYGYVDVSTDGGASWTPIQGNITTTFNPYGNNRGHGFTGASGGWVGAVFPLTAYTRPGDHAASGLLHRSVLHRGRLHRGQHLSGGHLRGRVHHHHRRRGHHLRPRSFHGRAVALPRARGRRRRPGQRVERIARPRRRHRHRRRRHARLSHRPRRQLPEPLQPHHADPVCGGRNGRRGTGERGTDGVFGDRGARGHPGAGHAAAGHLRGALERHEHARRAGSDGNLLRPAQCRGHHRPDPQAGAAEVAPRIPLGDAGAGVTIEQRRRRDSPPLTRPPVATRPAVSV